MIEKLRKNRDKKCIFAAGLTDLSKAFDCIPHNLLIAKLSAYGFDRKSLMFILAYLKSRKQRTRIGSAFSDYLNILFGVPQGSILGPILFIIFLSDLFYIYNDLDYANYADDTTPYVCRQNYAEAIEFLEPTINNIFAWFKNNGLVADLSKSYFLVSPHERNSLTILDSTIKSSPSCRGVSRLYNSIYNIQYTINRQYLATEAYKVKNGLSPVIRNDVFQFGKNSAYEHRIGNHVQRTNIQTVHFVSESIKILGAKI